MNVTDKIFMAIKHASVKNVGERGFASEWNAEHVVEDASGVGAACSLVVAASNSYDKAVADYVCDGTNDEEQINSALGDLPAGGGSVVLLDGTFNLGASIVLPKDNVSLLGQGRATVVTTATNAVVLLSLTGRDRCMIRDMYLLGPGFPDNATGIMMTGGTYNLISNIWAAGRFTYLIQFELVARCKIENIFDGGIGFGLIRLNDSSLNIVSNCLSAEIEIRVSSDSNINLIKDNHVNKIRVQNAACDDNVVHGNIMDEWVDGGTNTMDWDNYVF